MLNRERAPSGLKPQARRPADAGVDDHEDGVPQGVAGLGASAGPSGLAVALNEEPSALVGGLDAEPAVQPNAGLGQGGGL